MGDDRRPLITYDGLPVSSGGAHGLGSLGPLEAHQALDEFMRECTRSPLFDEVEVCVNRRPYPRRSLQRFGSQLDALGARRVKDVEARLLERRTVWRLQPNSLRLAVDWLADHFPLPPVKEGQNPGVAIDVVARNLTLKDRSGEDLPFQDRAYYGYAEYDGERLFGLSRIHAQFSERSYCNIFLSMPFFDVDDDRFRNALDWIASHLPFRLSSKHWRKWEPNKTGSGYHAIKVAVV